MAMNTLHRQLLLEGLHQASGNVLWGKLRHIAPNETDDAAAELAETIKEGGRSRSRSRKARA